MAVLALVFRGKICTRRDELSRLWQDGVLVGAQHMTDQGGALIALYWLSLQGADPPRRVSLPPPPEAKAQLLALWPTK